MGRLGGGERNERAMEKEKAVFKNRLIELLEKRVEIDENGEPILDSRVLGKKYTYLDLVLLAQIKKAISGDNSSASFIRDTSGNKLKDKADDTKQCTISFEDL